MSALNFELKENDWVLLPVPNLSCNKWKSASFCSKEEEVREKFNKLIPENEKNND